MPHHAPPAAPVGLFAGLSGQGPRGVGQFVCKTGETTRDIRVLRGVCACHPGWMPRERGAQRRNLYSRWRACGSRIFALPVLSRDQGRACVRDDKKGGLPTSNLSSRLDAPRTRGVTPGPILPVPRVQVPDLRPARGRACVRDDKGGRGLGVFPLTSHVIPAGCPAQAGRNAGIHKRDTGMTRIGVSSRELVEAVFQGVEYPRGAALGDVEAQIVAG